MNIKTIIKKYNIFGFGFSKNDFVFVWGDERKRGKIISFTKDNMARVVFPKSFDNYSYKVPLDLLVPYIKIK